MSEIKYLFVRTLLAALAMCPVPVAALEVNDAVEPLAAEAPVFVESGESTAPMEQKGAQAGEHTETVVLPPVIVVGVTATPSMALEGVSELDAGVLKYLPAGDGSLTETLSVLPGIQYSETENSSLTGGEILPPPVSISGSRVEENNFLLDGISIGSRLDPLQTDSTSGLYTPGHPQALFVHSSMLEQVTVHDSNISAAYGGFTGGVVEAELRRPHGRFSGELFYRTTHSDWTTFHLAPGSTADFEESNSQKMQPRFTKHDGGLLLDLPLSHNIGLLLAYQQTYSRIPLQHLTEKHVQTRREENYLARLGVVPSARDRFDLSFLYTPYRSELFRTDTKNSDHTVELGAWLVGGDYERHFSGGVWSVKSAYVDNVNRREAPQHLFTGWSTLSDETDWGTLVGTTYSYEGMLGDIEQTERSLQLKLDFQLDPLELGTAKNGLHFGINAERVLGRYDRAQTSYNYYANATYLPVLDPDVVCRSDDPGCRAGDQFMVARFVYPANTTSVRINRLESFIEDTVDWHRLQVRPGVRLSYDDMLKNFNVAPRLSAALDLFGDDTTVLTAGANRYYGEGLLAFALRSKLMGLAPQQVRDTDPVDGDYYDSEGYLVNSWHDINVSGRPYVAANLRTPYKDEWSVGLQQALLDGRLAARFIHRRGVDEFAYKYDSAAGAYLWHNNGRSRFDGVVIGWERTWSHHYLNINTTYTRTSVGPPSYLTNFSDLLFNRTVWYKGELLRYDELPWADYSRPWVGNLTYAGSLPWGLTFTNVTKYRGHYRRIALASPAELGPDGVSYVYELKSQPTTLVFDWRLDWQVPGTPSEQKATLSVEIYNVFDARNEVGNTTDEYEMGRQFWLGARYDF